MFSRNGSVIKEMSRYYEVINQFGLSSWQGEERVDRHHHDYMTIKQKYLKKRGNAAWGHSESIYIYKLPSLDMRTAIEISHVGRYYFVRGPEWPPDHGAHIARHIEINSQAKAQALINKLGVVWQDAGNLLIRLRLSNYVMPGTRITGVQQQTYLAELVKRLSTKDVLLYFEDFSQYGSSGSYAQEASHPTAKTERPQPRPLPPRTQPVAPQKPTTDFSDRKGVEPKSLDDAAKRLDTVKAEIASNGYHAKYTDVELLEQVDAGTVADERYHVRVLATPFLERNGAAGALGQTMETQSGKGAKYWSTTFDQLEDADHDAKIICEKCGIDHTPGESYTVAIIDTQAAKELTGVKSIVPTFDALGNFAKTELPNEFPADITDAIQTKEFQETYAAHHKAAVKEGFLESDGDNNTGNFSLYLESAGLSGTQQKRLRSRFVMQNTLGNSQHFEGNGLTKNLTGNGQQYGAVETFNFERKEINLDQLIDAKAIRLQTIS